MASPNFQLFTSLRYDPHLTKLSINTESWDGDIKFRSPFYILAHHRDRMLQAAERFGWTVAAERIRGHDGFSCLIRKLEKSINLDNETRPLRVKVLLSKEGEITVEKGPTPEVGQTNLFPSRIPPSKGEAEGKMEVSPLTGGALMVGEGDSGGGDPEMVNVWEVLLDTVRIKPSPYTSYKTTERDMYTEARERVGIKAFADKREVLIISEHDSEIIEGSLTGVFFWRDGKWTTPPVSSGGQVGASRRLALEKG